MGIKYINFDRTLLLKTHRENIKHYIWVLLYTLDNPEYKPEDIARHYDMAVGTVKAQLRELASKGYITWNPSFYKHAGRNRIPEQTKWDVWERDDYACRMCGARKFLSVDHIIPKRVGGSDETDNLQTLCISCNSSKGART